MAADKLQQMATALAASIPPHLGQPTIPPLSWHQEGEIVIVILADGRKVSASITKINELMFSQGDLDALESVDLVGADRSLSPKGDVRPDLDALEAVDLTTPARRAVDKSVDKPVEKSAKSVEKPQAPQKPQKLNSETKPK